MIKAGEKISKYIQKTLQMQNKINEENKNNWKKMKQNEQNKCKTY